MSNTVNLTHGEFGCSVGSTGCVQGYKGDLFSRVEDILVLKLGNWRSRCGFLN